MKCPECGAWSDVIETRNYTDGRGVKRRRVCANNHRFTTQEMVARPKTGRPRRAALPKEN